MTGKNLESMNISGNKINYQKELEKTIAIWSEEKRLPTILLHCCCAPCSSYCMEYLSKYAKLTAFYYNPNITDRAEYDHRAAELERLINEMFEGTVVSENDMMTEGQGSEAVEGTENMSKVNVSGFETVESADDEAAVRTPSDIRIYKPQFMAGDYDPNVFYNMTKGQEQLPEGGVRCFGCYRMRLEKTAQLAAEKGFDYFTTTLTISPLKNAQVLNQIGLELGEKYGVKYLTSDFKKKNGYKRSIELSEQYGLYRQNYCGCEYSKRD